MKKATGYPDPLSRIHAGTADRRTFLAATGKLFAAAGLLEALTLPLSAAKPKLQARTGRNVATLTDCAVVKGNDPARATQKAVELLGGISRFVKTGDTVVIKPNIGWNNRPEYAANTNPFVVEALVKLCRDAGAKQVRVFDNTCNDARMCYRNSGIRDAVERAGGSIYYTPDWKYIPAQFPAGSRMDGWKIFRDAVYCDCFINVPIAKHHGLTDLTLSIKNLMGICGGVRGMMHWGIDEKLADLAAFIKPELTIVDAYCVLLRNGPSGGSKADTQLKKTIIASADPVLADAYAAQLMGRKPENIGYIKASAQKGLGNMNPATARIARARV